MKKIAFTAIILTAQQTVAEEITGNAYFDGLYFGAGVGGGYSKTEAELGGSSVSDQVCRPMATVLLGQGKTANSTQIYFGAEILTDIAKTASGNHEINGVRGKIQTNGVNPSFAFRIGRLEPDSQSLIFARVGLVHSKVSFEAADFKITASKLTPVFGVGVEMIREKASIRFDVEYRMNAQQTADFFKIKSKFNVNARATAIYYVRF
jgi:hypothetical protein